MPVPSDALKLYEELALQCQRRQDSTQRDVFLVLAADSALASGQVEHAERLRRQLLEQSPYTLLRPFASFGEALKFSDIHDYVVDLRQQYPPEAAAKLLESPLNGHDASADVPSIFDVPALNDIFPLYEPPSTFDEAVPSARAEAPQRPATSPPGPAPTPVANPRRRSPYENPDYGPRIPTGPAPQEFAGFWIIYLLIVLVALLGLAVFGYMFIRPMLNE